ncbi:MAG: hypothetical protein DCC55_07260 [Chloroflexi bacterium]|nr:MAG: hypothetical protein DCC55_07260 [Chloroflexota bacterium]
MSVEPTLAAPNPWPIRAISLLMAVQALCLAGVIVYFVRQVDWDNELIAVPSPMAVDTFLFTAGYGIIAVMLLMTATSFYFQRRSAWVIAIALQGLALGFALWIYFGTTSHFRQSPWLYVIMAYSVILVLYLNTADVRTAFLARTPTPRDLAEYRRAEGLTESPALLEQSHEQPDW